MNKTVLKQLMKSFLLIWLITSLNYILLHEYALLSGQTEILRRIIKFGMIGSIYWIGKHSLQQLYAKWPLRVWQLIYLIGLLLIIGSGIYHQITQTRSTVLSYWMGNVSTALQSPIIFLGILFLMRAQKNMDNG